MADDLENLDQRVAIFRTFCPPPMNELCKRGPDDDCDVAYLIKCAIDKCAEELKIPASLREKLLSTKKNTSPEKQSHHQTSPPYLTSKALNDFQSELEVASDFDFDVSNKTELSEDEGKLNQLEDLLKSPRSQPKIQLIIRRIIRQSRRQTTRRRYSSKSTPTSLDVVVPKLSLRLRTKESDYTVLPPEKQIYTNLPFGLIVEPTSRNKCLNLPESLCDAKTNINAQIRFDLPEDLSKLKGLTVLDFLMRYCIVQPKLSDLLKDQYSGVPQWQKIMPHELIREHVDKALIQLVSAEELDDFISYFDLGPQFVINAEIYVRIMALSIRLYGNRLKDIHKSWWSYQVGVLEWIDYRTAAKHLKDISLHPQLDRLLRKLCQIAWEQAHF